MYMRGRCMTLIVCNSTPFSVSELSSGCPGSSTENFPGSLEYLLHPSVPVWAQAAIPSASKIPIVNDFLRMETPYKKVAFKAMLFFQPEDLLHILYSGFFALQSLKQQ